MRPGPSIFANARCRRMVREASPEAGDDDIEACWQILAELSFSKRNATHCQLCNLCAKSIRVAGRIEEFQNDDRVCPRFGGCRLSNLTTECRRYLSNLRSTSFVLASQTMRGAGQLNALDVAGRAEMSSLGTRFLLYPQAPHLSGLRNTRGGLDFTSARSDPIRARRIIACMCAIPCWTSSRTSIPICRPSSATSFRQPNPALMAISTTSLLKSRQFLAAHAFASVSRVLDIWESYLGQADRLVLRRNIRAARDHSLGRLGECAIGVWLSGAWPGAGSRRARPSVRAQLRRDRA